MRAKPLPHKTTPGERVAKDIRRATRRYFSAGDKIRIVPSGMRGCLLRHQTTRALINPGLSLWLDKKWELCHQPKHRWHPGEAPMANSGLFGTIYLHNKFNYIDVLIFILDGAPTILTKSLFYINN